MTRVHIAVPLLTLIAAATPVSIAQQPAAPTSKPADTATASPSPDAAGSANKLRPDSTATRRNSYQRLFGLDTAPPSPPPPPPPPPKPKQLNTAEPPARQTSRTNKPASPVTAGQGAGADAGQNTVASTFKRKPEISVEGLPKQAESPPVNLPTSPPPPPPPSR